MFSNEKISKEEIEICIKNLKNNKAFGEDKIISEYIKSTSMHMLPLNKKIHLILCLTLVYCQHFGESVV